MTSQDLGPFKLYPDILYHLTTHTLHCTTTTTTTTLQLRRCAWNCDLRSWKSMCLSEEKKKKKSPASHLRSKRSKPNQSLTKPGRNEIPALPCISDKPKSWPKNTQNMSCSPLLSLFPACHLCLSLLPNQSYDPAHMQQAKHRLQPLLRSRRLLEIELSWPEKKDVKTRICFHTKHTHTHSPSTTSRYYCTTYYFYILRPTYLYSYYNITIWNFPKCFYDYYICSVTIASVTSRAGVRAASSSSGRRAPATPVL